MAALNEQASADIEDFDIETLLEAEELYRRYRMLETMYDQNGPFPLSAYPKHKALFDAGAKYDHRAAFGGNGCITPWTAIETAEGERPIAECLGAAALVVRSWADGARCDAQASGVFLKEFAPAFRVHLDNDRWFDCNHTHRVLTTSGWLSFDQLIRASSGLRWMRTGQGSQASCAEGGRRCGEQPHGAEGSAPAAPPSAGGARRPDPSISERAGALARTPPHSRACQAPVRPASRIHDPALVAALCAPFADPTAQLDAQWCSRKRLALWQLAVGSGQHPAGTGGDHGQAQSIDGAAWPEGWVDGNLADWMFCPRSHPGLIGGNRIVGVIPLGVQPILDLTVERTGCYFAAGVVHHNTGKSFGAGGYETALHATGLYPPWWDGLRFDHAVKIRCCGDTRQTMREIIQLVLLGDFAEKGEEEYGTGLIPRHLLGKPRVVQNTNGLVDYVKVKHVSGGWSTIQFRAYEQGRKAFQGTKFHFIWEDEEPPIPVHEENVQRGRGVDGKMLLTFTPLSGFSEVVENFIGWEKANREDGASRFMVTIAWDDVPHLSEEWKRKTLAETRPHMRKTRMLGIPNAGEGMVYPVEEDFFVIPQFPIPDHFRRVAGFDHGWNNTAAVWIAYDKDEDVAYLYSEYKRGEALIETHATALRMRGDWIPFIGDSSARDSDGKQIIDKYRALGVKMTLPDKSVDAGVQSVLSRLETGRLKVFNTCTKFLDEFRKYSYKKDANDVPQIVKRDDHLLDATRYAIHKGLGKAIHRPSKRVTDLKTDLTL